MHVRTSTRQYKGKTYQYAQLVESFRRPDGKPSCRVVAHLGTLPEQTLANLRLALKASRAGQAVVLPAATRGRGAPRRPEANLAYLNVAVLVALWRQLGVGAVLGELLGEGDESAPPADVVAALALHRCIAPGSKLHAQRWYPTTALPELLGMMPPALHNTRVHRVLDALHVATPALMARLPSLYTPGRGAAAAFFMDVTRTHFEGRGCDLAEWISWRDEGRRLSIGIVLLVDEHGFPMRWQVISGRSSDMPAMRQMVDEVAAVAWLGQAPVVFDRAMGQPATLAYLLSTGVRFVTAAHAPSIERFTEALPYRGVAGVPLSATSERDEQDVQRMAQAAREAGMEEVSPELFVLDLGVVDARAALQEDGASEGGERAPALRRRKVRKGRRAGVAAQLELARSIRAGLDGGRYASQAVAARQLGLTRARVTQLMNLLRLSEAMQARIVESPGGVAVSERQLRGVLREPDPDRQRVLLEQALARAREDGVAHGDAPDSDAPVPEPEGGWRLRLVGYFVPRLRVDQQRHAEQQLRDLEQYIADLNAELCTAAQGRNEETVRRRIYARLEHVSLVDAFEVTTEAIEVPGSKGPLRSWRCTLTLKPDVWARRRRYHGFMLLVCHPDLPHGGADLVRLYREKDTVEKDFQTIKGELKLRPIFHYADSKVQAHVTLCMLALLLERELGRQLRRARQPLTARACLEILRGCHLNRYRSADGQSGYYALTETTAEQGKLLRALKLEELADDTAARRAITPRLDIQ
jgi:DNA-binding transcriptional regulator YdaS (Cro superfamily)